LQKIGILDLSLIKLLQNEQGCNFLHHSVVLVAAIDMNFESEFDILANCVHLVVAYSINLYYKFRNSASVVYMLT